MSGRHSVDSRLNAIRGGVTVSVGEAGINPLLGDGCRIFMLEIHPLVEGNQRGIVQLAGNPY